MKGKLVKLLAVLSCFVLGISFVACGGKNSSNLGGVNSSVSGEESNSSLLVDSSSSEDVSSEDVSSEDISAEDTSSEVDSAEDSSSDDGDEDEEIYVGTEGLVYTVNETGNAYTVTGYNGSATEVVIPPLYKGVPVTGIGDGAFTLCVNITVIVLPETLETVGNGAFEGCSQLREVKIPDKVQSLGDNAFKGCSALENVQLGKGLTEIGDGAFTLCVNITVIIIGENVTVMGENVFDGCEKLLGVLFSTESIPEGWAENAVPENMLYAKEDWEYEDEEQTNVIFYGEWTEYIAAKCGVEGEERRYGINDVEKYQSRPIEALEHSFTNYKSNGDATCTEDGTKTATCDNGCGETDTIADEGSATGCSFTNYKSNGDATCTEDGTKTATCDNGCGETDTIADEGSAGHKFIDGICSGCGEEKISEGFAFVLNEDGTSYSVKSIGTCTDTKPVIPSTHNNLPVTSIGDWAFSYCDMTGVVIPDSVTSIGDFAFEGCYNLTEVYITDIEAWCNISGVSNLMGYGSSSKKLYVNHELVTELKIPNTITAIKDSTFYQCSSLMSVVIPDSVTSIGDYVFSQCYSLTEIKVSENNTVYKSLDDNLYSKDGTTLIQYASGKTATSFTIPDGVTSIGDHAISYCNNLTSIIIPDSVTSIGDHVFSQCYSLTEIVIPDSVTSIGSIAFYDCGSLTIYCEVESRPSGWSSDWDYNSRAAVVWNCNNNEVAANGCIYAVINGVRYALKDGVATVVKQPRNIESANIPERITYKAIVYNVTSIGAMAFNNCSSLTEIVIPDSVTSIGDNAFCYCGSLTSLVIPDSVTSIGKYVFGNCDSLTIYCEAESMPSGWNSYWNHSNCPVVWGYKGE